MSKESQSVGDKIYSGSVSYGKISAKLHAVIATILGLIAVIVGIVMIVKGSKKLESVDATISKADCSQDKNYDPPRTSCELTLSYKINDKTYTPNLTTKDGKTYAVNNKQKVFYYPNDPNTPILDPFPYTGFGILALVIGVLIIGGSWFWVWLTGKYEMASNLQTLSDVSGLFIRPNYK